MEITIEINEWLLYVIVMILAMSLANSTLDLLGRYLKWRLKRKQDKYLNR